MHREAIADERTRIARELHDLVGHTLTLMLVRAGAARVVLDSSPEQAREILLGVEQTGREALEEMDHVLGVLRRDDDVDLRPGLSELPHLAQRLTEAGMDVAVRIERRLSTCRAAWTFRRTGSCRRHSPTHCGTGGPVRPA
jgi:signal transduction histidine kinase